MRIFSTLIILLLFISTLHAQKVSANKKQALSSIEKHASKLIETSDNIWAHAEIAFQETESYQELANLAEANGFKVERGVAEIPTAFVATYGSGSPVIGILGEFDALPGLSQKAVPNKDPLAEGKPGHGCGHNLF